MFAEEEEEEQEEEEEEEIMPGIEKYMLEEGECQRGVMHSAWLFCIALTF